jgi:prepilin signal peptidase PulO-like enzyme (type II secretory pathway)
MTDEGMKLLLRAAAVLLMIAIGAIVRTFIGPSRGRGIVMFVGMFGGMMLGVLFSYATPISLNLRESALLAILGLLVGWAIAWPFARRIPREAR